MMAFVFLIGCTATGGIVFAAIAMILGCLCVVYDHKAFTANHIGAMMIMAGACGMVAGGIMGIAILADLQSTAPAVIAGGGTWV